MSQKKVKVFTKELWNIFQTQGEKTPAALDIFVAALAKKGALRWQRKIVAAFLKQYYLAEKVIPALVISTQKLEGKTRSAIEAWLMKRHPGKKIELAEKIDREIVGGIILEADGERVDLSAGRQIQRLKNWMKVN